MTIRDLKAFLSELSDDTIIVVPGSDHSYRKLRSSDFDSTTAMAYQKSSLLFQDYGDEYNDPGGVRKPVLVIS